MVRRRGMTQTGLDRRHFLGMAPLLKRSSMAIGCEAQDRM